ncbi:MAG: hypothetical protein FJ125_03410 [Deltaproteobacteria bacterium]|nr:hypothetical protein [Deltaproteobacteria bacterium]
MITRSSDSSYSSSSSEGISLPGRAASPGSTGPLRPAAPAVPPAPSPPPSTQSSASGGASSASTTCARAAAGARLLSSRATMGGRARQHSVGHVGWGGRRCGCKLQRMFAPGVGVSQLAQ